jgi:hypothetical protein
MCITKVTSLFLTVDFQSVPQRIFVYPVYCTLPGISHHTYLSWMSGITSFCFMDVIYKWYMGQTRSSSTYALINFVISIPVTKVLSLVE